MEKPFLQVKKVLAAPLSEMPDIVFSALKSQGFADLTFKEIPYSVNANFSDYETHSGKRFTKAMQAQVIWTEDKNPPEIFSTMKAENKMIDPMLVTVRLKPHKLVSAEDAKAKLQSLWSEIKEIAEQTSAAIVDQVPPTDYGTAQWATLKELKQEGYLTDFASDNVNYRFFLGSFEGHDVSVPKMYAEAHAIVAGPPGVGKSRSIYIPNLIKRVGTSAIVTEVTAGEKVVPTVYAHTAGYRASHGHKIYYLNPADLANSTRFNPVDRIANMGDAIRYATLIITNTTSTNHIGDQIWPQAETQLLAALLLYVWGLGGKKRNQEGGPATLGNVRNLLRHGPVELEALIKANGIPEARDRFSEFIKNSSPNFRLGVVSGLIARLNPWLDPRICALTEVTDFDAHDLKSSLFTFYLAFPVHRPEYKPLMALAVNYLANFPMDEKFDHPFTMFLDEFAAYGTIPNIGNIQATIRNNEVALIFGFQDQSQLGPPLYSRNQAESIFANTDTKVLFATGAIAAQQQISQLLGQTTKIRKQVSSTGHITRQTYGLPLLSAAEVGRIPLGKAVIHRLKKNPILIDTVAPSTYAAFPKQYPPPAKELKPLSIELIEACDESEDIQFDQQEAQAQTKTYKDLWESFTNAKEEHDNAVLANKPASHQDALLKKMKEAKQEYESFHEQKKDVTSSASWPEETKIEKSPEEPQLPQASSVTAEDPNAKFYVFDEDPNAKFYVYDDE